MWAKIRTPKVSTLKVKPKAQRWSHWEIQYSRIRQNKNNQNEKVT